MQFDIATPTLSEEGARRLEWAGRRMPVLATLRERYRAEKPLEGRTVAACLHVTAETANLMLALKDAGARPAALHARSRATSCPSTRGCMRLVPRPSLETPVPLTTA